MEIKRLLHGFVRFAMTLRFDLDLRKMKELADWDEQNHQVYNERFVLHPEDYKLPYKLTHPVRLTSNDAVVSRAVDYTRYHKGFLRRHFHGVDTFDVSYGHLIQFYSESLDNIFRHGGRQARETDTVIELYHPDASRFILRISNPVAAEWNYERTWKEFSERDPADFSKWGGFKTFSQEFALVSYADKGRDFLALITPPLR